MTYDVENNCENMTPLMLAIIKEQFNVADILLHTYKADVYFVNINNENI